MNTNKLHLLHEYLRQQREGLEGQQPAPFHLYFEGLSDANLSKSLLELAYTKVSDIRQAHLLGIDIRLSPTLQELQSGVQLQPTFIPPTIEPPLNAEFLLHLLLRHDEHDAIMGDLIERYGKKYARLGLRRANFWFYSEVFWTALPLIKRALLKISGMMTLAEFVRRHIS